MGEDHIKTLTLEQHKEKIEAIECKPEEIRNMVCEIIVKGLNDDNSNGGNETTRQFAEKIGCTTDEAKTWFLWFQSSANEERKLKIMAQQQELKRKKEERKLKIMAQQQELQKDQERKDKIKTVLFWAFLFGSVIILYQNYFDNIVNCFAVYFPNNKCWSPPIRPNDAYETTSLKLFNSYDLNCDGELSKPELAKRNSLRAVATLMAKSDMNDDSKI